MGREAMQERGAGSMAPGVGFDVPEGTPSRASFIEAPQAIRKQYRPWGEDGDDTAGEFSDPKSKAYRNFVEDFWGRFGKLQVDKQSPDGWGVPESPADHWPQWQQYLRAIAEHNPGFLEAHRYGKATGNLEPTREEIFTAWMAGGSVGPAIQAEGVRLNLLHGGPSTAAIPRPEDYDRAEDYQSDFSLYLSGQPIKGAAFYRGGRAGAGPTSPPAPPVEPSPPPASPPPPPPPASSSAIEQKLDSIVGMLLADGVALATLDRRLSAIEAGFIKTEQAVIKGERSWWAAEISKLLEQFKNRPAVIRALQSVIDQRGS